MVSLVVGFPGSGKSYYAVKKIYDILSSLKPQTFDIIYTNIGGIKFDYFPNSKVKFKKLKENQLLEYLNECYKLYELYKNENSVDEYLIKYSKEQDFYNALIVFDECHDFFSNQDKIKIFWLTYHRHLNHEIILLTQNKTLIHSKYRAIPELFIEAQPRSKKLFSNTLNYKHYSSFAMRKADLFNTSSIKTDQEIFKLYQSGNKSTQKSIIVKFIVILTFGLLLAIFLFYNLINGFSNDSKELNNDFNRLHSSTNNHIKNTKDNLTLNNGKNNNSNNPKSSSIPNSEDKKQTVNNFNNNKKSNNSNIYFNIQIDYNSIDGYTIYNHNYNKNYFKRFLTLTKSKVIYKTIIFKLDDYKIEKLILRTSQKDLSKYFLIPNIQNHNNNNIKRSSIQNIIDNRYKSNNIKVKRQ